MGPDWLGWLTSLCVVARSLPLSLPHHGIFCFVAFLIAYLSLNLEHIPWLDWLVSNPEMVCLHLPELSAPLVLGSQVWTATVGAGDPNSDSHAEQDCTLGHLPSAKLLFKIKLNVYLVVIVRPVF